METLNYVRIGGGRVARPQEIILLTADANYTNIHLSNGRKMMVATTLKKLEKRFEKFEVFFRTHKSSLVNMSYVQQCDAVKHEMFVQMKNNCRVAVSRRKKSAFMKRLSLINSQQPESAGHFE